MTPESRRCRSQICHVQSKADSECMAFLLRTPCTHSYVRPLSGLSAGLSDRELRNALLHTAPMNTSAQVDWLTGSLISNHEKHL